MSPENFAVGFNLVVILAGFLGGYAFFRALVGQRFRQVMLEHRIALQDHLDPSEGAPHPAVERMAELLKGSANDIEHLDVITLFFSALREQHAATAVELEDEELSDAERKALSEIRGQVKSQLTVYACLRSPFLTAAIFFFFLLYMAFQDIGFSDLEDAMFSRVFRQSTPAARSGA